ncbi:hypothetical protein [Sphingobacterium paludis]|uniref:Uncharacterized protein n=1 Tax=Sphingobacterium paludis TaxID=1476465 RepID=A0A4R7D366_9SPHI|nr:hypothetical protein [Sphingobacterium paludis]TDS14742.1 hypothetical protein B0I21_103241 [Sphingobacterium paludis]
MNYIAKDKVTMNKVCYVVKNMNDGRLLAYTEQEHAVLSAAVLERTTGVKHEVIMCYLDKQVVFMDDNLISK